MARKRAAFDGASAWLSQLWSAFPHIEKSLKWIVIPGRHIPLIPRRFKDSPF